MVQKLGNFSAEGKLSITGAARGEILPFLQLGAAFEKCEAGVF